MMLARMGGYATSGGLRSSHRIAAISHAGNCAGCNSAFAFRTRNRRSKSGHSLPYRSATLNSG